MKKKLRSKVEPPSSVGLDGLAPTIMEMHVAPLSSSSSAILDDEVVANAIGGDEGSGSDNDEDLPLLSGRAIHRHSALAMLPAAQIAPLQAAYGSIIDDEVATTFGEGDEDTDSDDDDLPLLSGRATNRRPALSASPPALSKPRSPPSPPAHNSMLFEVGVRGLG